MLVLMSVVVVLVEVYLCRTEVVRQRVWFMSGWSISGFDGGAA